MRVLLHDFGCYPFTFQLSKALAGKGHEVAYAYSAAEPKRSDLAGATEAGVECLKVDIGRPIPKDSALKRRAWTVDYGRAVAETAKKFRPDVVISSNTPLDAQAALQAQTKRSGARFVYWLQDILSIATREIISKKNWLLGNVAGWYYERMEASTLRNSDTVIAITEDFFSILDPWGVARDRVEIIENWSPIETLPLIPRDNAWARKQGLVDKVVLLYAGQLGLKHDPGLLADLAQHLSNRPEAQVVVISEGGGVVPLRAIAEERKLQNITFLPFQPYDELPYALGTADVLMAILEEQGSKFCVPSKVLTYLCSGRPILLSVTPSNLSARIVEVNKAGLVAKPGDVAGFCQAAEKLLADPELRAAMGRAGRQYAEDNFDIEVLTNRFDNIVRGRKSTSEPRAHAGSSRT